MQGRPRGKRHSASYPGIAGGVNAKLHRGGQLGPWREPNLNVQVVCLSIAGRWPAWSALPGSWCATFGVHDNVWGYGFVRCFSPGYCACNSGRRWRSGASGKRVSRASRRATGFTRCIRQRGAENRTSRFAGFRNAAFAGRRRAGQSSNIRGSRAASHRDCRRLWRIWGCWGSRNAGKQRRRRFLCQLFCASNGLARGRGRSRRPERVQCHCLWQARGCCAAAHHSAMAHPACG